MEEKFTDEEKSAVASVLFNLADADFQSKKGEGECNTSTLYNSAVNKSLIIDLIKTLMLGLMK